MAMFRIAEYDHTNMTTIEYDRSIEMAPTLVEERIANALTVDVEEYFQVSAFDSLIDRSNWGNFPSRVESRTDLILSMFDEAKVKGTFFTLGCVAERFPNLVRRICDQGHELASHGWEHTRLTFMTPTQFREDVRRTKAVLEDISGTEIKGYRAPSYSIDRHNNWAHDILADTGHLYSSSVAPINHDLYGIPDAPRFPHRRGTAQLLEIPISTVAMGARNWPCGGGGWFRLYPYWLFSRAFKRINKVDERPGVFYIHPWELDPDQPRQDGLDHKTAFRHYQNLGKTEARMRRLLTDFRWQRMDETFVVENKQLKLN